MYVNVVKIFFFYEMFLCKFIFCLERVMGNFFFVNLSFNIGFDEVNGFWFFFLGCICINNEKK